MQNSKVQGCFKFLSVEYYQKHFEITTDEVIRRVTTAMLPIKPGSIFGIEQKYDLYGPIWIVLTLNIMIGIFGNFAGYLDYVTLNESNVVY